MREYLPKPLPEYPAYKDLADDRELRCARLAYPENLKRIEKAWFPVSQFSRTAGF